LAGRHAGYAHAKTNPIVQKNADSPGGLLFAKILAAWYRFATRPVARVAGVRRELPLALARDLWYR